MKKHFSTSSLLGFCAIFLLLACGKPLPPEWASLEGTWTREDVYLKISKEGDLKYRRMLPKGKISINGFITDYNAQGFNSTLLFKENWFIVSQKPTYNDSTYLTQMVVDGRVLTKGEGFYKGEF